MKERSWPLLNHFSTLKFGHKNRRTLGKEIVLILWLARGEPDTVINAFGDISLFGVERRCVILMKILHQVNHDQSIPLLPPLNVVT